MFVEYFHYLRAIHLLTELKNCRFTLLLNDAKNLGLGCACSEVIPFVVLMRHFQRYRGTVISAMYIITAVSGFLMPVLYEYVRQEWGFRICLLVMGERTFKS